MEGGFSVFTFMEHIALATKWFFISSSYSPFAESYVFQIFLKGSNRKSLVLNAFDAVIPLL